MEAEVKVTTVVLKLFDFSIYTEYYAYAFCAFCILQMKYRDSCIPISEAGKQFP